MGSSAGTMTEYIFRPANPSDASQISHLIGTTWAKYFAYSVTPSDLDHYLTSVVSTSQIALEISSPDQRFLVATLPNTSTIAGVAQLSLGPGPGCLTLPSPIELQRLYVSPEHHGSGLSRVLMHQVDELARKEGARSIWLGVWENNPRAEAFYRKCGYREVGEKVFMLGQSRRRDLVLQKSLD